MEKPTTWTSLGITWDALPINCFPSRHGYTLYEAIRERCEYIIGSDWETSSETPTALKSLIEPFPCLRDYKAVEQAMHNAVSELILHYINWTNPLRELWTESSILLELKEEKRIEPSPYYLSAKWLFQMYRIVNYMRKQNNIISITWIDEAESIYTEGSQYAKDKATFEQEISYDVAVIKPGKEGRIIGYGGKPSNVLMYNCSRNPCSSPSSFIEAFNKLKAQYTTDQITVGLFVDASGSMELETIQPAYDKFVKYIHTNYPTYTIIERQASNERWLNWTLGYIQDLRFNFENREEENEQ